METVFMNRHFRILNLYGFKPHLNTSITATTLLWLTGGSENIPNDYFTAA